MNKLGRFGALIELLLVEDSAGDARLTLEAFREANEAIQVYIAEDGVEAMAYLRREGIHVDAPRPDLILLDLNMPRMDGRQVLERLKDDKRLSTIPTIVLTTSSAETDIATSYALGANCYMTKPVQLDQFDALIDQCVLGRTGHASDCAADGVRRPTLFKLLG